MKFLHIADVHLDQMINNVGENENKRRHEIIEAFSRAIQYIKNMKIEYLFIAGDFYEHKYIKDTTIEIIINLFKEISNTKIFITPGNHDPFVKDSIYDRFDFPENVYIFRDMEMVETKDANIFGFGFTDFYPLKNVNFGNIKPLKNGKKNILIAHTDIYSKKYEYDKEIYRLMKKDFDYIALGHIHSGNYSKNSKKIYPGSFAEFTFKAADGGTTGGVFGTIERGVLKTELLEFDNKKYIKYKYDISLENSLNSIIMNLNNLKFKSNEVVRIVFVGTKKISINKKFILDNLRNENIIQIEDQSKLMLDYKKYKNEISLRGIYIKKADNIIKNLKKKQEICVDDNERENYYRKIKLIEKAILLVLEEMNNI